MIRMRENNDGLRKSILLFVFDQIIDQLVRNRKDLGKLVARYIIPVTCNILISVKVSDQAYINFVVNS